MKNLTPLHLPEVDNIPLSPQNGFYKIYLRNGVVYKLDGNGVETPLGNFIESDPIFTASVAYNISTQNTANWNTAYGWGNHATQGYLKVETDPIFTASPAFGISNAMINQWITSYNWGNHAVQGYLTQAVANTLYAGINHTHSFAQITGKPTTLTGYGITDPVVLTSNAYSDPAWITALSWNKIVGAPSFVTALAALTDVQLSTLSENQVLRYSNGFWRNWSPNFLTQALADTLYLPFSSLGAPNGVASLNGSGQVPASQLPSYVDDVVEYVSLATFPTTGETGKIYLAQDTNEAYRWSGSSYIKIANGAVQSVNTQTGNVVLDSDDINEGVVNLYYSNAKVKTYADTLYVALTGSYSNPSWITSLAWSKITGVPPFITGIDANDVVTALGYSPVTNSRTLTINGVTFDLTANRTWTVGDILSTGSYANPDWITSLAWTKITGVPSFLTGSGTTNYVTKWSGSSLVDSIIFENGGVGIGTNNPSTNAMLHVVGGLPSRTKSLLLDSTWNYQTSFSMRNGNFSTEFNLGGTTKSSNEGGPGSLQVSTYNATTNTYRYPVTFYANGNVAFAGNLGSVPADNGNTLQVNGTIQQNSVTSALLKASATGVLVAAVPGVDYLVSVTTPTLDTVTTAGNVTTNAITVGNVTVNGNAGTGFFHNALTNYDGLSGLQLNRADGTERAFFKLNPFSGEVRIGAAGTGYYTTFYTASAERMRIFAASGNVAINTTTDSGFKLDVNGTARVSELTIKGSGIALISGLVNTTPVGDFSMNETFYQFRTYAAGTSFLWKVSDGSNKMDLTQAGVLRLYALAGTGTRMVVADEFGQLSVQAVPSYSETDTLDSVTTRGNTTTNSITVGNVSVIGGVNTGFSHTPLTNYNGFGGIQFNVADGTERAFFKLNPNSGELKIGVTGSGYFTTLHTSGVERMRIFASTGNVAIGITTDSGYKLDVNGSTRVKGLGSTTATTAFLVQNSSSTDLFRVYDDGTVKGGNNFFLNNTSPFNSTPPFTVLNQYSGIMSVAYETQWGHYIGATHNGGTGDTSLSLFGLGTGGGYNGAIRFWTSANSRTPVLAMIVDRNQNVGIGLTNSTNLTTDTSAKLQIDSSTRGFLQPRMTNTQVLAITTPATGLQAYDTTNNKMMYYDSTAWRNLASESWVISQGYITSQPWVVNGSNIYYNTGNVGVGIAIPTYKLHVVGTIHTQDGLHLGGNADWIYPSSSSGFMELYSNQGIKVNAGGALSMFFVASGNVLVGSTTDAGYKFDVTGQARFSDHVVINTDAALFSGSSYNGYKMLGIGSTTGGGISFVSSNGIAAEIFGDNTTTGLYLASYGAVPVITFYLNTTEVGKFTTAGDLKVANLGGTGSRMVVADANGVLSTQAIPTSTTPTLDQVTTAGNITTNTITVGGITSNGAISFNTPFAGTHGLYWTPAQDGTQVRIFGSNYSVVGYNTLNVMSGPDGLVVNGNERKLTINAAGSSIYLDTVNMIFTSHGTGEAMRIVSSSKNVLIGTTTDSGYTLNVNGTFRVTSQADFAGLASPGHSMARINDNGTLLRNDSFVIDNATGNAGQLVNLSVGATHGTAARLFVKGSGSTSATNALLVQNSSATAALTVRDDGYVIGGSRVYSTGNMYMDGSTGLLFSAWGQLQLQGASFVQINNSVLRATTSNFTLTNTSFSPNNNTNSNLILNGNGNDFSNAGAGSNSVGNVLSIPIGISTSIGNVTLNHINISGVVNTTAGTTLQRGFYYNPTLTGTVGFTHRAIETTSGDVIFSGGNLGIGTTTPTGRNGYGGGTVVEIVNNSVYASFNINGGSVGSPTYLTFGAQGTGADIRVNNKPLQLSVNSIDALRIATTANVLIGTTTDSGYKLDVNGTLRASGRILQGFGGFVNNCLYTYISNHCGSAGLIGFGFTNTDNPVAGDSVFDIYQGVAAAPGAALFNFKHSILNATGNLDQSFIAVTGTINRSASVSGIVRGIYYNPTTTAVNGTHYAWESTSGKFKISDLSGTGTRMVVADANGVLGTQAIPTGGGGSVTSVGLTIGTSGTDINVSNSPITSSGDIVLNIPNASETARGVVSTANQTFVGKKTFKATSLVIDTTATSSLLEGKVNGVDHGYIYFGPYFQFTATASATSGFLWKIGDGTNAMELAQTGRLRFNKYGINTFAGTATKGLGVDADGYVVEYTIPASGGSISLTTTGSSGAATLVGTTLNIPTYTLTGLGGVPTSRTLTINGVTFDLTADRSWTVTAATPTLAEVTTAGDTTTNAITVGGLTVNTNDATIRTLRIGLGAGSVATNMAIGVTALNSNSTGTENTAIGYEALYLSTGIQSTVVGYRAGKSIVSQSITAIGHTSFTLATGTGNTGLGRYSGSQTTTGAYNTAVGESALSLNTTGVANTAVGYNSVGYFGAGTHSKSENVGVGYFALAELISGNNNVAVGVQALWSLSAGSSNTAIGWRALAAAAQSNNTAVGFESLRNNSTASGNVAVGYRAGYTNSTGTNITAIGYEALYSSTGSESTAVGYQAGRTIIGNTITAIGYQAGYQTTGTENTVIGNGALINNTSGAYNTMIGHRVAFGWFGNINPTYTGNGNTSVGHGSMYYLQNGSQNVALGISALFGLRDGSNNVAIGSSALSSNNASGNVAVGWRAAFTNTTASEFVAIGYEALYTASTNIDGSVAIGYQAARNATAAVTAIGRSALLSNTGARNTAVGIFAMSANTSGMENTAMGYNSMNLNKTGSYNTAYGYRSLMGSWTGNASPVYSGSQNVAIGFDAMVFAETASENTAVGTQALYATQSGNFNAAVGLFALGSNNGNNNTAIGYKAGGFGVANTTGANNIFIGYQATGVSATESNRTWIGNSATTSTWLAGNVLIGTTTNSDYKLDVNGSFRNNGLVVLTTLSAVTTTQILYYDAATGVVTYGAAPGGGGYVTTAVTTSYVESATSGTKFVVVDTTGGAVTVTLPSAVGNTATLIFKKTAGTASLILDGAGSETIDGGTTATLVEINESVTLLSNNSNWLIV